MRFWNLSSVLWITEWGLLRCSVCSGSPQAFDPARCYLSAGVPSQESSLHFSQGGSCELDPENIATFQNIREKHLEHSYSFPLMLMHEDIEKRAAEGLIQVTRILV